MTRFVDTSALIAVLAPQDDNHVLAGRTWQRLLAADDTLVTSNYIVVEMCALLQRRSGMPAVRRFLDDIMPSLQVHWVDDALHASGIASMLASGRNGPNIVDCTSFAVMRHLGIRDAFAFDPHFEDQGFHLVP